MLTISTYLAPSAVHGIGLYVAEAVAAGTQLWKFNPHLDKIYSERNFLRICREANEHSLRHLLNSSYKRGGRYYYLTDNARFINHSEARPNIGFVDDYTEIALKDIAPHQELLENYLLSYDTTDFFFQERQNPDPFLYLHNLSTNRPGHAYRQNLP